MLKKSLKCLKFTHILIADEISQVQQLVYKENLKSRILHNITEWNISHCLDNFLNTSHFENDNHWLSQLQYLSINKIC